MYRGRATQELDLFSLLLCGSWNGRLHLQTAASYLNTTKEEKEVLQKTSEEQGGNGDSSISHSKLCPSVSQAAWQLLKIPKENKLRGYTLNPFSNAIFPALRKNCFLIFSIQITDRSHFLLLHWYSTENISVLRCFHIAQEIKHQIATSFS